MSYRDEIPTTVNIRIKAKEKKRKHSSFDVLLRGPKGWIKIADCPNENKALAFIEQYHTDKDIKWSTDVKIRARWICEEPGCGEGIGGDKALLEAHHIEPVAVCPEKRHDLDNGKCLCLFHHAATHAGWAHLAILARLGLILLARLYPHKKTEIQRMAG